MKTVILCGGRGTRFKEQTDFIPKPLAVVGTRPILWHIMKIYDHYGFQEFVLPLGYKGELIKDFFVHYNWKSANITVSTKKNDAPLVHPKTRIEDWMVHLFDTGIDTLTGKRISLIKHLLENDEYFMVTYGDGVADIDIMKLIQFHKEKGLAATITGYSAVKHKYGIVDSKDGVVLQFNEKPPLAGFINAGFMVFSKSALSYFDEKEDVAVETILARIAADKQLALFPHNSFWFAMDTQKEHDELCEFWKTKPPWKVWNE